MGPAAGPSAWRAGLGRAGRATSLRGRERDLPHAPAAPGTPQSDRGVREGQPGVGGPRPGKSHPNLGGSVNEPRYVLPLLRLLLAEAQMPRHIQGSKRILPCFLQTRALQITSLNTNSESFFPPLATPPQFPQEALLRVNPCEQADSHFIRDSFTYPSPGRRSWALKFPLPPLQASMFPFSVPLTPFY